MPGICECGAIGVRVVTVVFRGEAYYGTLFDGRMYLCMRCLGSWTLTHRATARVALSLGSEPVHGAPIGSGPAPQGGHDAGVDGAEMPGVHAAAPVLTEQALADVDKRDPAKAAQMPAQHAQWPVAQRSVAPPPTTPPPPPPPPAAQKRMMPPTPPPAGAGKHRKITATTPAAVAPRSVRSGADACGAWDCCPTTADSAEFCLLCCQPEPVSPVVELPARHGFRHRINYFGDCEGN